MPRHQQTQISGLILGRLAFYLRTLTELADAGHSLVSSQTLAEILGLTAAQVRKDLSVFGGFGKQGTGYEVIPLCRDLARFVQRHAIEVAIIAVPADQAQAVAERLVAAGVRAILNYAPTALNVPSTVRVEDVDPVIHLQRMAFHLRPALRKRSRAAVTPKASKTERRRSFSHQQKLTSRPAPLPQAAGGELH